jgi:hypothetical protein
VATSRIPSVTSTNASRRLRSAGYRAALSTQPGFSRRDVDRFRVDASTCSAPIRGDADAQGALQLNDGTLSSLASYCFDG